jgi:hypothetical protein
LLQWCEVVAKGNRTVKRCRDGETAAYMAQIVGLREGDRDKSGFLSPRQDHDPNNVSWN